ncbi:hypothetical protein H8K38_04980 [Undibacterium sp. FT79W]|uniref:hypothetical protein n=1 Tax=Undibacterium sp. FT79W TaxID=2762296 RepID=UPI00164C628D|nr:hypothetical protein [Undibacterium sp. FT79W]MBC3877155.1 hypothetical protein [Undibacterium sp. FT79W]
MNKSKLVAILGGLGIILAGCGGFVYTSVGGTVTGLGTTGANSVILMNEQNFTRTLTADGPFSFNVASNANYSVVVYSQPNLVNCTVANGTGKMTGEGALNNILVTCVPNVPVSGTLSGMADSGTITLNNNTVNPATSVATDKTMALSANGAFQLTNYVVSGYRYNVTVAMPPAAQYCTVANGTGVADNKYPNAINNVAVSCVPAVPVKVTVNGLTAGNTLTLSNATTAKSTADTLAISTIGIYNFGWSLLNGMTYAVTVATQPTGQTCTVQNASGVADITKPDAASNVVVNCA